LIHGAPNPARVGFSINNQESTIANDSTIKDLLINNIPRDSDSPEFALIEPVHQTSFARVDDDVAGPAIVMAEHRVRTEWAGELAFARTLTARQSGPHGSEFMIANGVDECGEAIHLDQHAVACRAGEQRVPMPSTARQRRGADRATVSGLGEPLEMLEHDWRFLLVAAVIAHEHLQVPIDPHRSAAITAICHDRLIGQSLS
jgi:hypothetical protein